MEALFFYCFKAYLLGFVLVLVRGMFRGAPALMDRDLWLSWVTVVKLFQCDVLGYEWRYRLVPAERRRQLRAQRAQKALPNPDEPLWQFFRSQEDGGTFERVTDTFREWFAGMPVADAAGTRFRSEKLNARSHGSAVLSRFGGEDALMSLGELKELVVAHDVDGGVLRLEGRHTAFVKDAAGVARAVVLMRKPEGWALIAYDLSYIALFDCHSLVMVPVRD